jgi:nucleoside-diphosphate-sugar epimerase
LIGRHVIALAARTDGIEVIATSRERPDDLPNGVKFIAADLSNSVEAAALVRAETPTHIVHTAWVTTHPTYWHDRVNLQWAEAAGAMADAFGDVGGQRFVQLGSCAEYDWSHEVCVEGQTPDNPATLYGQAKLEAFRRIQEAAGGRFEAVEGRIFWVFGPGENPSRLIPVICRSYLSREIPELGSGRQKRDLLFVEDAASAILALARSSGLEGVINIAAGEEVELAQVAIELARLTGVSETGLGRRADRPDDPERLIASAERIRSTRWKANHSLAGGLAKTLDWWRATEA